MAPIFIIPLTIVAIVGLAMYLIYKFVIYDFVCRQTVTKTLQKYNIKETPSQIVKEYHITKGEDISEKEAQRLEKHYRQHEPEQFLAMYDTIRDRTKTDRGN